MSQEEMATYHDHPLLKEPVWIWSIPVYFHVGGLSGAAGVLAAAAEATNPRELRGLIHKAHWVAAVGDALSAALLIHDLGRPARFLNMLRVFRPTSPMSVGSWVLSLSGACNALAALASGRRGAIGRIGAAAGYAGGALGLPLAGYTGVLIAGTAVPVWLRGRRTLPPLFMASAMASAASLLELLPLRRRERAAVHRYGVAGQIATLLLAPVLRAEVGWNSRAALPLRQGRSGALWKLSQALHATHLLVSLWPARDRRRRSLVSGALGTAAGLALRWAIFEAGKASARDPRAAAESEPLPAPPERNRIPEPA